MEQDINIQGKDSLASETKQKSLAVVPGKNKYRSGVKWIILSGILGVSCICSWYAYNSFNPPPQPISVATIPVQKETLEVTVTESGKVELGGQQTLKAPSADVTVDEVKVSVGSTVKAGQPLLVLRDRTNLEQLNSEQVNRTKHEITLARNRQKVLERQESLKEAKIKLKESEELFKQGFVGADEVKRDRNEAISAEGSLRDAQLEVQTVELDIKASQLKIEGYRQKLQDTIVNSPMDGKVLAVKIRKNDGVKIESPLLTLGDPKQELVKLQLTTLNASKIRINQSARVSIIGPNPKIFTGKVIKLAPQASSDDPSGSTTSSGQSQNNQAKVDATVALDEPSKTLIPGSQVSVEIILEQRKNVLAIPLELLQRNEGEPFVWIRNSQSRAEKKRITLGLEGLAKVEILSGLRPGDEVVLAPPTVTLSPGAPLQINQEKESEIQEIAP